MRFNVLEFRRFRALLLKTNPSLLPPSLITPYCGSVHYSGSIPIQKKTLSYAPLCRRHVGNTKIQKRGNVSFINDRIKIKSYLLTVII